MGDPVDIRVNKVDESLRRRFRAVCELEGNTYEEMIQEVTAMYEHDAKAARRLAQEADRENRRRNRSRDP